MDPIGITARVRLTGISDGVWKRNWLITLNHVNNTVRSDGRNQGSIYKTESKRTNNDYFLMDQSQGLIEVVFAYI